VHDPPGLEIGDYLLNDIADLVDLFVEFFLPIQEVAAGGLLDGGDHVVADVSFVTYPVAGIKRAKRPGFTEAVRVMSASVNRVGNPREPSAECARDLRVHAGRLVLAGVQLGMRGPRPARKQSTVHDVLCPPVKVVSRRNVFPQHLTQQGCYCGNCAAYRRLGNPVGLGQFFLGSIAAHICQCHDHGPEQSEDWRPVINAGFRLGGMDHHAQVNDLALGESRGMIHS